MTTLALLIRKSGISAALFSRYWRDVHGVLAARIPGFESYVQYHLGAPFDDVLPAAVKQTRLRAIERFDGLAEVCFKNAEKRLGLATSDVTAMIQDDEQNVFRTSLLYNLNEDASHTLLERPVGQQRASVFILLGGLPGSTRDDVRAALDDLLVPVLGSMDFLYTLRVHLLLSGEQQSWQTAGVENQQTSETAFDALVQLDFAGPPTRDTIRQALAALPAALYQIMPRIAVYPARACHVMVAGGRPTELGLRGLDASRTIAAAGALNQRSEAVLRCLYGASAFGAP